MRTACHSLCFSLSPPPQVLSLVAAPFLMEDPHVRKMFPADAILRAKHMLNILPGGIGAYQDSRGATGIREEVRRADGRMAADCRLPGDPSWL